MKHFRIVLASLGVLVAVFGLTLYARPVLAANTTAQQAACEAINGTAGCTTNGSGDLTKVIGLIINIMSVVIGAIAVIMIIVAGYKYISSGGESGKVTAAKNTLIYAIIGLVIVALAQFMVRFVLKQAKTISLNQTVIVASSEAIRNPYSS